MADRMKITDAEYEVLVGNDKGASVPVLLTNYGPDDLAVYLHGISAILLQPHTSRIYVCTDETMVVRAIGATNTAEFSIG